MKLTKPFFVVLVACSVVLGGCPAPKPPEIVAPAPTRAELQAKINELQADTKMPDRVKKGLMGGYQQQLEAMPKSSSAEQK